MLPIAATTRLLNEIAITGDLLIDPVLFCYGVVGIAIAAGLLVSRAVFAGPHTLFPGASSTGSSAEVAEDGFEVSAVRVSRVSEQTRRAGAPPAKDRQNAA